MLAMRLIKENPPVTQVRTNNGYLIGLMSLCSNFIFVKSTNRGSTFTYNGMLGDVDKKLDELSNIK